MAQKIESDFDRDAISGHPGGENKQTENKFICTTCGKMFPSQSIMEIHFITHTGEKPGVITNTNRGVN